MKYITLADEVEDRYWWYNHKNKLLVYITVTEIGRLTPDEQVRRFGIKNKI